MRALLIIFTLSTLLAFTSAANAEEHFHYEISLQSKFNLDNNQLKSIRMVWLYDEAISEMMLEQEQDLQEFSDYLLDDLKTVDYFTRLSFDGKPIKISKATNGLINVIKNDKSSQLELSFDLLFAKPINMSGKHNLNIANSDNSGAAILFYKDASALKIGKTLKKRCTPYVKDKEDFKHGEAAQTVEVNCH